MFCDKYFIYDVLVVISTTCMYIIGNDVLVFLNGFVLPLVKVDATGEVTIFVTLASFQAGLTKMRINNKTLEFTLSFNIH